jgi:hypothetical protein
VCVCESESAERLMWSSDKMFYFSSGKFRCTELKTWGGGGVGCGGLKSTCRVFYEYGHSATSC